MACAFSAESRPGRQSTTYESLEKFCCSKKLLQRGNRKRRSRNKTPARHRTNLAALRLYIFFFARDPPPPSLTLVKSKAEKEKGFYV